MNKELIILKNIGDAEIVGTSFVGEFPKGTKYTDIVEVFGEPSYIKDDKVKVEWRGRIDGMIFTIYDYKSDVEPEHNTDWHIGGYNDMVDEFVIFYFKLRLKDLI